MYLRTGGNLVFRAGLGAGRHEDIVRNVFCVYVREPVGTKIWEVEKSSCRLICWKARRWSEKCVLRVCPGARRHENRRKNGIYVPIRRLEST